MKALFQKLLIRLFSIIRKTGFWENPVGQALYLFLYKIYKDVVETGDVKLLGHLIAPNSAVIDVGANVGYFTLMFGQWINGDGRVVSIEPEESNFQRLQKMIKKEGLTDVVETVQAAASNISGTGRLVVDTDNPADHFLGQGDVEVSVLTIDDILLDRGIPDVSMIKIDVQGGEINVLKGAENTIRRSRPALFIEVDGPSLVRSGSSPGALLDFLYEHEYSSFLIQGGALSDRQSKNRIIEQIDKEGYLDVLFLPEEMGPIDFLKASDHEEDLPNHFQKTSSPLPLLLFVGLMLSVWYLLTGFQDVGFWWHSGDYPYLSLAHALGMEDWLLGSGERTLTPAKTMHPGIPFQIVSWLLFRSVALIHPEVSGDDFVVHVLQNPEGFWEAAQFAVVLINVTALYLIWRISRPYGLPITFVAFLACFSHYSFWQYGVMELGNESFALIGAVLFFLSARQAFMGMYWNIWSWMLFGGVCAGVYLIKLQYITWSAAVPIGLLTAVLTGERSWQQAFKGALSFITGFALLLWSVGGVMVGNSGLLDLIGNHIRVITRTGLYGHGDTGIIEFASLDRSLNYLFGNKEFLLVITTVILLALIGIIAKRRDNNWVRTHLPIGVTILGAFLLSFLAVVKHFNPHYFVVSLALIPLISLWAAAAFGRYVGLLLLLPIGISAVLETVSVFQVYLPAQREKAIELQGNVDEIMALPLAAGQIRLWDHVPGQAYRTGQVLHMSGIERYKKAYWKVNPSERMINGKLVWPESKRSISAWEEIPWRYAVFSKRAVSQQSDLPKVFSKTQRTFHFYGDYTVIER